MIGWTNPAALWGLALVAAPVVVHLLRRHRAARLPFPTLRFVRAAETAAIRVRWPSDVVLLLLRMAIICLAIAAIAGPVLLTEVRLARWNSVTARAIVVDTSESMQLTQRSGMRVQQAADEAALGEMKTAAHSARVDDASLEEGIRRGTRWLSSAPPARRELVVISDFQRGTLGAAALRGVPASVGVRFVRVGEEAQRASLDAPAVLVSPTAARPRAIETTPESTAVAFTPEPARGVAGLRFMLDPPADTAAPDRIMRAVVAAGTAAPAVSQPIAICLGDCASGLDHVSPIRGGWMLDTVLNLMTDPVMQSVPAGDATSLGEVFATKPWTTVLRNPDGKPIVSAAALGREELLLIARLPPESLYAAGLVRSALNARARANGYGERERASLDRETLDAWQRPAAPVDTSAWRQSTTTDARWFWLMAVVFLGFEQWLRTRTRHRRDQEVERAAA